MAADRPATHVVGCYGNPLANVMRGWYGGQAKRRERFWPSLSPYSLTPHRRMDYEGVRQTGRGLKGEWQ